MSQSSTITEDMIEIGPVGVILFEEFLQPLGLSQTRAAKAIGAPPRRINEIVRGARSVTADASLRLARLFGVSDDSFLNLQADYDMRMRRREIAADLAKIQPAA